MAWAFEVCPASSIIKKYDEKPIYYPGDGVPVSDYMGLLQRCGVAFVVLVVVGLLLFAVLLSSPRLGVEWSL